MKNKRRQADANGKHTEGKENVAQKKAKVDGITPEAEEQESKPTPNRPTRNKSAGVSYKETSKLHASKQDYTIVVEEAVCDTEQEALEQTPAGPAAAAAAAASSTPSELRRLYDFTVTDQHGVVQPLERLNLTEGPLSVAGVVQPATGEVVKANGRRFTQPAALRSWALVYIRTEAQVHLKTVAATYIAVRASASYKKLFGELEEQAQLMLSVYHALTPEFGGSSTASLDDVVAKLARAKIGRQYGSARDALMLNATFVESQLAALAAKQSGKAAGPTYANGPFATGLKAALASWVAPISTMVEGGAIQIKERPAVADGGSGGGSISDGDGDTAMADRQLEADAEMALRMQARLDAEAAMGHGRAKPKKGAGQAYMQISESEIADDYPVPAQYTPEGEEMDELVMADEDVWYMEPDLLPRCQLTDFSIYNSDGFYASLELLPMWNNVDPDIELFASGVVAEDNGDWVGVQVEEGAANGAGGSSGDGGSGAAAAAAAEGGGEQNGNGGGGGGMRIFSSAIKEWCVDCSCDLLRISIRTDVAWYQLIRPASRYSPWFHVVVKAARLAVHVITLLDNQTRAAKLSFNNITKLLAELEPTEPSFISKKIPTVERFLVVHGQIILNQMKHFPKKAVANSAFGTTLRQLMERRRHCKLYAAPKGKARRGERRANSNPMKDRSMSHRLKPMTATATLLVKGIWQNYFQLPATPEAAAAAAEPVVEVEEDVNEEDGDDGEPEVALAQPAAVPAAKPAAKGAARKKPNKAAAKWVGASSKDGAGRLFYRSAAIDALEVRVGDVVSIQGSKEEEEEGQEPVLGMLSFMWEKNGIKMAQLRKVLRGSATVLGDAASPFELFLTPDFLECTLLEITGKLAGSRLEREWDPKERNKYVRKWESMSKELAEALEKGEPRYFWSSMYEGRKGMFRCPTSEEWELGTYHEEVEHEEVACWEEKGKSVRQGGHVFALNDFVCVAPTAFEPLPDAQPVLELPEYVKGKHKGSNLGLRAWGVAQILDWQTPKAAGKAGGSAAAPPPTSVKVRRLWRPEDVSRERAHDAGWWDVYWSEDTQVVDVEDLLVPCRLVPPGGKTGLTVGQKAAYTFACTGLFNKKQPKKLAPLPEAVLKQLEADGKAQPAGASSADKGKGKAAAADSGKGKGKAAASPVGAAPAAQTAAGEHEVGVGAAVQVVEAEDEAGAAIQPLKSLDVFAGCGGLSEGMKQAGVAESHWAIEYEEPAAQAFRLNHPKAVVWANNCNVLLLAAMRKAGADAECVASAEAEQQAAQLGAESVEQLPSPGEVDFIMGGPPCQGYSGMNRFNKGAWSCVQNSMVMAYLSYADFFRPRYFLLENVRNFVSHNKSLTFRLTLRTLLDLGYQVRFGVLNAGYYGVPQSRKRTFIWAGAPGEKLPDWPAPIHTFHSPQLSINLPDGSSFCAAPATRGAPLRSVTVRDAISDLPAVENGADREELEYGQAPISAYQQQLRRSAGSLLDHVCKRLNDVNMERCRCIPKETPGADWRVLLDIVDKDPSREKFKGQPLVPWCLPNTADRHNGWRGLFGRVDLDGHFPTAVTDPNPMGKVGQVFHPSQDRIVSVRECARSQGFPDHFRFYGNVHNKHRQVGNAVPPPLACALGRQLRRALFEQQEEEMRRTRAKW